MSDKAASESGSPAGTTTNGTTNADTNETSPTTNTNNDNTDTTNSASTGSPTNGGNKESTSAGADDGARSPARAGSPQPQPAPERVPNPEQEIKVEELQNEIHSLEEQIRDRSRVLKEKLGEKELTHEQAEEALKEAEANLAAAQEELKTTEQERETLKPQYDRCQQNKDQHAKAEAYKKEIAEAESELKKADQKIKALENRLQTVSASYKTERERRSLLVAKVSTLVEELGGAVEEKIALTFPVDEAEGAPKASVCLQRLAEMGREREMEIARWTRYGQELTAILELKKQRSLELEQEAERQVALTAAAKDEEIKSMVLRFNEERRSLQEDIENVRSANAEQLEALHRPKVVAAKEISLSQPKGGPQKRDLAPHAAKVFTQRTADLEKEKEELAKKISATSAEKHKLTRATQELRRQIEAEDNKFSSSLRTLENQILNERNSIADLIKENSQLEELCEGLKVAIRP